MAIRSPGWLKSALLVWDHVYRIVPSGVEVEDSPEVLAARDQGLVRSVKLEQDDLSECANDLEGFLETIDITPAGFEESEDERYVHADKIDKTLYPLLAELATEIDPEGWLKLPRGVARSYMLALSYWVAKRRNISRVTDDPDAWAIAPFITEDGNFDEWCCDGEAEGFYSQLVIPNLLPTNIATVPIEKIIDFNTKRSATRQQLRSRLRS